MTMQRTALALVLALAMFGCGKKKEEGGGAAGATGAAESKSGLAWTPEGYDKLSPNCKKALACCEEIAKAEGAKEPGDFNGKCSGPAMWKPEECDLDRQSIVTVRTDSGKPVPDACK
jgi:hypothetical protein